MINPSFLLLPQISLAMLPSTPIASLEYLPNIPGVYFVVDSQGSVLYVGRSIKMRNRLKSHHRKDKFDAVEGAKVAYLVVEASLLEAVEEEMINHFDPLLTDTPIIALLEIQRETYIVARN